MKFSIISLFVSAAIFLPQAQAVTLREVLKASPLVSELPPGPYALHTSYEEATVLIDGRPWEIRYVTLTDTQAQARNRTIAELARDFGLLDLEGQEFEVNPKLTTVTWFQSDEMKEQGIYMTVSMKPVETLVKCSGCTK